MRRSRDWIERNLVKSWPNCRKIADRLDHLSTKQEKNGRERKHSLQQKACDDCKSAIESLWKNWTTQKKDRKDQLVELSRQRAEISGMFAHGANWVLSKFPILYFRFWNVPLMIVYSVQCASGGDGSTRLSKQHLDEPLYTLYFTQSMYNSVWVLVSFWLALKNRKG